MRGAFDAATASSEDEPDGDERKSDRKDGDAKRSGVRLAAGGDAPVDGVAKTRADNANGKPKGTSASL